MDDISVKIRRVLIEEMGVELASVSDDASLASDLDLDSIELTEFALLLETEFDVEIPDEFITASATVGDVVEAIRKLKG